MFCENCGNEIEKTSKYCPVCGQRVEAAGAGFKGRKRTGTPARAVSRNLIYGFLGLFAPQDTFSNIWKDALQSQLETCY